jgi:hypothetical protein
MNTINSFLIITIFTSLFYLLRSSIYIGKFDPLKLLAIFEGLWTYSYIDLFTLNIISFEILMMLIACLSGWYLSWFFLIKLFGKTYIINIKNCWLKIKNLNKINNFILFVFYLIPLIIIVNYTIISNNYGDARISMLKSVRIIEGFTTLLCPIVLYKLLTFKTTSSLIFLIFILMLNVIIGGKSSIFIILLPLAACELTNVYKFKIKEIVIVLITLLLGIFFSILLIYESNDGFINVLTNRIKNEGDIYYLVFSNSLLENIKMDSLILYLIGPFIKLISKDMVDINIGAQIGSLLAGFDVFTGPNGHWPILLLAYGLESYYSLFLISVIFFTIVIGFKFWIIQSFILNKLPLFLIVPLVSFSSLFPQNSYAEPSNFSLYLLQLIFVSSILIFTNLFFAFKK